MLIVSCSDIIQGRQLGVWCMYELWNGDLFGRKLWKEFLGLFLICLKWDWQSILLFGVVVWYSNNACACIYFLACIVCVGWFICKVIRLSGLLILVFFIIWGSCGFCKKKKKWLKGCLNVVASCHRLDEYFLYQNNA